MEVGGMPDRPVLRCSYRLFLDVSTVIERYVVKPDELAKETPYIKNNIRFTRIGFGLDKSREELFSVKENMPYDDIKNNEATIHNIRLWDHRPLIQTYKQLQDIRLYYDFNNADMDRYQLQSKYTEVAVAARELPVARLARRSMTWVNTHLVYTHGYGVAMGPVNKVTPGWNAEVHRPGYPASIQYFH